MSLLRLIDWQGNAAHLYSSKTKPDIVGNTKMRLKAKFTKLASSNIKIPVAPIPTTKTLSSLVKSSKFGQQTDTWHCENLGQINVK